ncbi:kinase-like protein [Gigaspora margarita]|uniref:Kinase-like protein n=1 Tax=Gigaspora margarita TaxID=4874 RepID=A0A8H4AIN6_GIGMA|nr:kinase-like protein [Gigaspora margarita]
MPTLSYEKWLETAINEYFIKAFDYNSFNNFNKIGSGGFGNVYSAHSELLGIVAIKKLRQDFDNDENTVDKFIRELRNITKIAQHKNIIQFFGIAQDPKTKINCIILQYANDGDLRNYLQAHFSELDWPTKIRMAKEISHGINWLHNENIVHRDLEDTKFKREKLSDIYSLGVIFWELSSGRPPFKDMTLPAIILHVSSGKRESPIDGTPNDFIDLYREAWNDYMNSRPDIANVLRKLDCIRMDSIYRERDSIGCYIFFKNEIKNTVHFTYSNNF